MTARIMKLVWQRFCFLRKDDQGAAMMITLAVFLFLYLMCASTYAVGQTVHEKIRIQNICDAAAYSAAVVEADGISKIATINRAMAWTYVQMVRQQMDYITLRWLWLTHLRFNEDRNMCAAFNSAACNWLPGDDGNYFYFPWIGCPSGHRSGNEQAGNWWCGWSPEDGGLIRCGYCTRKDINGNDDSRLLCGGFLSNSSIAELLAKYNNNVYQRAVASRTQNQYPDPSSAAVTMLRNSITSSKELQTVLSAIMRTHISEVQTSMASAAQQILEQHLASDKEEYRVVSTFPLFDFPYDILKENGGNVRIRSVLAPCYNTEEDELEFLASCMHTSNYHEIFEDGIDQWFIRGRENTLSSGDYSVAPTMEDYCGTGFRRGYKSANRQEAAGNGVLRGNHVCYGSKYGHMVQCGLSVSMNPQSFFLHRGTVAVLPTLGYYLATGKLLKALMCFIQAPDKDIEPSCINYNTLFPTQCSEVKNNYGLVSEYHWSSMKWWCAWKWKWIRIWWWRILIPTGQFAHYKACPISQCDAHGNGDTGGHARGGYTCCFVGSDNLCYDTHGSDNGIPGYITQGYTRIYGDDQAIYEPYYYNTAWVTPVKLHGSFFQDRIHIAVAKKQKNPFYWMFSGTKSIFNAFDPVKTDSGNWMVAVSEATAAPFDRSLLLENPNAGNAHLIANAYDTKYNQITGYDEEFSSENPQNARKSNLSAVSPIQLAFADVNSGIPNAVSKKYRIGCPHRVPGNHITERLRKVWNLSETDWNAVFVPIRYANDSYYASYDGYTDSSTEVKYRLSNDYTGNFLNRFNAENTALQVMKFENGTWSQTTDDKFFQEIDYQVPGTNVRYSPDGVMSNLKIQ